MSSRHAVAGLAIVLVAAVGARPACAEEPTPPATSANPPSGQIEEVVVTAQKRSEYLSKVPISVTAIDQSTLNEQGAKDVADVARLVPGLNLQSTDELGDTNISIRGIISDTGAQTTGVYIDDTPVQARQETVSSNPYPKIFDLDRVEVLRGPQGTLFGAGSEGGTIRFLTPEPGLQTYTGFVRSELAFTDGGAPSYELGSAVGGPIIPGTLGFRATAWYRDDGGYTTRIDPVTGQTEATDANGADSKVAKLAFKWAPTDNLIIVPSIYYQDLHSADRSFYFESVGPFNELSQIPQPHSDKFVLPSLSAEYDFDAFSVKSITSYFKRDVNDVFDATSFELSGLIPTGDQSFGGITLPGYPNYLSRGMYHETQNNWTEELRFTSTDDPTAKLSWVGGFYIQHNIAGSNSLFAEPFDDVAAYLTGYYCQNGYPSYCGAPPTSLAYFGEAPIDGKYSYQDRFLGRELDKAVYGNATYAILDDLKASIGLRVARSGFDFVDYQDGPYGTAAPQTNSGSEQETPVTPRFNLAWQVTPDQLVYATAAKGYRIGGANEPIPVDICANSLAALGIPGGAPLTFNSDSVWSYEVGAKGKFLDGHVVVDSSLYWINWTNIQQQVYLPDCGYYYTSNEGSAVSRGFDIQAEWAVGGGWVLSGNAGLTDAYFTKTIQENGQVLAGAGDSLATPKWTATAAAEYNFKLRDETDGYARLDYQFSGAYGRTAADTFSYNPNTGNAPATHYVTIRAGVKQDGWDISAFMDNVLNSRTSLYRYQDTQFSPDLRDSTFRPLTAGVTAEYRF